MELDTDARTFYNLRSTDCRCRTRKRSLKDGDHETRKPWPLRTSHRRNIGEAHNTLKVRMEEWSLWLFWAVYLPMSWLSPMPERPEPNPPRLRFRSRNPRRPPCCCAGCCWWWCCCCCSCNGAIGPRGRTPPLACWIRRADSLERRRTVDHSTSRSSAKRRQSSSPTWFSTSWNSNKASCHSIQVLF